jgi:hypothetical protein
MSENETRTAVDVEALRSQAIANIRALIAECAKGISDREAEAAAKAKPWEELQAWVKDGFAKARPKKAEEAEAKPAEIKRRRLVEPTAQPKPEPTAEPEPVAPEPLVRSWDEVRVPEGASELEALTYVPGLVGDIVEWIVRGSRRPNRMMAFGRCSDRGRDIDRPMCARSDRKRNAPIRHNPRAEWDRQG